MSFKLENKLVLVTGASSGIGKITAVEFARKGASLALVGRNETALRETGAKIKHLGRPVKYFVFDLTQVDKIPALVGEIESRCSDGVDVLVNCAGTAILGLVEDVPVEEYGNNLQVNFYAPLALIKAVLPGMKQRGGGQIINVLSGAAKRGLPGSSAYCASKAALNSLTESLRVELRGDNIDIISVSPGLVKTKFQQRAEYYGRWREIVPESVMSDPEYVARKIVQASIGQRMNVELSLRTRLACHLNYLAPRLFDCLLAKKYKNQLSRPQ